MPSIFENPILMIVLSLVALCVVGTVRAVFPDKRRLWLFLFPLGIALAGISLDALVQSDREKIRSTVKAAMKAVERADIAALGRCLAEDYQDSFHHSKIQLLQHAEEGLERSALVKAKIAGLSVPQPKGSDARTFITAHLTFTPDSFVAKNYKALVIAEIEFRLHKQPNGQWLITSIEVTEVDKQPLRWPQIQGHF